jgi:hypothetical protein
MRQRMWSGDKCLAAPRAEAEKKLGEEMLSAHQLKGGGGGGSGDTDMGVTEAGAGRVTWQRVRGGNRGGAHMGRSGGKRKENGSGPSE